MRRLSRLGLLPDPSTNMHNNFAYKMKSDGRLKCRTTMGNNGIPIAYDVGSSELGLRENFIDILKDIGFLPCSSMPNNWTRMIGDRLDRVVSYCGDDLVITSWNPEFLKELLTTKHDINPMKNESSQHVE